MDGVIDILNYVPQPHTIRMDPERDERLLGTDIPAAEQYRYLALDIRTADDSSRRPCRRDHPLLAGRRGGHRRSGGGSGPVLRLQHIPTTLMRGQTTLGGYGAAEILERRVSSVCRAFGLR